MKVACWDLEFFNFEADKSVLLCGAVKPLGKKPIVISDGRKGADDSELIKNIMSELEKYHLLVGWYTLASKWRGRSGGDFRMLRTRAFKWHIPRIQRRFHLDLWRVASRAFNTGNHRLSTISDLRDRNEKTDIKWNDWCLAAFGGDEQALDRIKHHCYKDTVTTEKNYYDFIEEPDLIVSISRA